jgi:hypothetical protein
MNANHFNQTRIGEVEKQIKSLHDTIQNLSIHNERQHDDALLQNQKGPSDWTNIYNTCNDLVGADEVKALESKLSKLKRKHEILCKSNPSGKNYESFCCSSQNRDAERTVAKMTHKQRLSKMKSFRCDHGNVEFRRGNLQEAKTWYDKSLIYYEYCFNASGDEAVQIEHERLLCLLNLAACNLVLCKHKDCIENCDEVMEAPNCPNEMKIKALLRRSKANRLMHNFEISLNDLNEVKSLSTLGPALSKNDNGLMKSYLDEYKLLQHETKRYKSSSKALAKRMMKKLNDDDDDNDDDFH